MACGSQPQSQLRATEEERFFHGRDHVWIINGRKNKMRKRFHLLGDVTGLADSVSLSSLSDAQCLTSGEVPSLSNGELRHLQGELLYQENGLRTQLKHLFLGGQRRKDFFVQSSIKEKFNCPDQPVSGVVHSS